MSHEATERPLVRALDLLGVGVGTLAIGAFLVAAIGPGDPVTFVVAVFLFLPYLAGYMFARVLDVRPAAAVIVVAALIALAIALFLVTRDATWLAFLAPPCVGFAVSSLVANRSTAITRRTTHG